MTRGVEMAKKPEKSSFSVTCSLLSQYIKEKGSLADLGLGLADSGKAGTNRPPTTMDFIAGVDVKEETKTMELFPQSTDFGTVKAESKVPEKSQLTIFYGGKVLVFDNFPADKARDLMQLASKGQSFASGTTAAVTAADAVPAADTQSCLATSKPPATFPARTHQPNFSDLPIARKASLHRFLEKRKDRISAKTPYQLSGKDGVTVKEEEISKPWLGLGPHISKTRLNSNCAQ